MVTLSTAKQLKEAGWGKKSFQYYRVNSNSTSSLHYATPFVNAIIKQTENYYPCPSLEELLAELPDEIYLETDETLIFSMMKIDKLYCFNYEDSQLNCVYNSEHPDPSEACALLWIKLKKEGLL